MTEKILYKFLKLWIILTNTSEFREVQLQRLERIFND